MHKKIREHLLRKIFLPRRYNIEELYRTEWSHPFERLMRNRLVFGAYRYGRLHEANKPVYDRVAGIQRKLEVYKDTHNTEMLVDIANLAMLEFEEGCHPKKTFRSVDDQAHTPTKE